MRNLWLLLVFALALPLAAGAISMDVEAHAGGGLGIGLTSNPSESGSPHFALQGGLVADVFLFKIGPVDLGLSTGLEYDNMNNHGTTKGVPVPPPAPPGTTQTLDSDNTYSYLIIPLALTTRTRLTSGMDLSLRVGGFYGFFLGGQANNITSSLGGSSSSANLDSSNTSPGLLGLHFSGGLDFALGGGLFLSPSLIVNFGLTNINTVPSGSMSNYTFYDGKTYVDSLGSITLMIGLKYDVF